MAHTKATTKKIAPSVIIVRFHSMFENLIESKLLEKLRLAGQPAG